MATKSGQRHRELERREKLAAARREAERADRRRRVILRSAVGGGVLVGAGLVTLAVVSGRNAGTATTAASTAAATVTSGSAAAQVALGGRTTLPPWPNAKDPAAATKAAGLTPAREEGTVEHYHAHLDILVDGKPVPVAAEIGVDERAQLMSPLHTHDGDGVIHVESPTKGTPFSLGQLFTEWDLALSTDQLGGLRADGKRVLTAYVNGTKVSGNPASITLAPKQQITLVYGAADQKVSVPATYDFGNL